MHRDEIIVKLRRIIVNQLGVDDDEVTMDADFVDDLGADSLDSVEVLMEVEEQFGLEIPDDDADTVRTVKDAVDYVEKRLAASPV